MRSVREKDGKRRQEQTWPQESIVHLRQVRRGDARLVQLVPSHLLKAGNRGAIVLKDFHLVKDTRIWYTAGTV